MAKLTLLKKQQLFSSRLSELITELNYEEAIYATFGEAWRSPETCEIYAKDGRGILHSLHPDRLAVDLNLFINDQPLAPEDYQIAGDMWKDKSTPDAVCIWGGDFKDRPDVFHFSIEHNGVK